MSWLDKTLIFLLVCDMIVIIVGRYLEKRGKM